MTSYGATSIQVKNKLEALGYTNRGITIESGDYKWTRKDVLEFVDRFLTDDDIEKLKELYGRMSNEEIKKETIRLITYICSRRIDFAHISAHIYNYGVYSFILSKWNCKYCNIPI